MLTIKLHFPGWPTIPQYTKCLYCFGESSLLSSTHDKESLKAFVKHGFSSWAKALEQFRSHQMGLMNGGKTDADSNLMQFLNLDAKDIPEFQSWLVYKESKWLSHDIIDKMTEMKAHDVLRMLS